MLLMCKNFRRYFLRIKLTCGCHNICVSRICGCFVSPCVFESVYSTFSICFQKNLTLMKSESADAISFVKCLNKIQELSLCVDWRTKSLVKDNIVVNLFNIMRIKSIYYVYHAVFMILMTLVMIYLMNRSPKSYFAKVCFWMIYFINIVKIFTILACSWYLVIKLGTIYFDNTSGSVPIFDIVNKLYWIFEVILIVLMSAIIVCHKFYRLFSTPYLIWCKNIKNLLIIWICVPVIPLCFFLCYLVGFSFDTLVPMSLNYLFFFIIFCIIGSILVILGGSCWIVRECEITMKKACEQKNESLKFKWMENEIACLKHQINDQVNYYDGDLVSCSSNIDIINFTNPDDKNESNDEIIGNGYLDMAYIESECKVDTELLVESGYVVMKGNLKERPAPINYSTEVEIGSEHAKMNMIL